LAAYCAYGVHLKLSKPQLGDDAVEVLFPATASRFPLSIMGQFSYMVEIVASLRGMLTRVRFLTTSSRDVELVPIVLINRD
jgi:hypothetical protein